MRPPISAVEMDPDYFRDEIEFFLLGPMKTHASRHPPHVRFSGVGHFAFDLRDPVIHIDEADADVFGPRKIKGFQQQAAEARIRRDTDRFRLRFPLVTEQCVGDGRVNAHAGMFTAVLGQSRAPSFMKQETPSGLDGYRQIRVEYLAGMFDGRRVGLDAQKRPAEDVVCEQGLAAALADHASGLDHIATVGQIQRLAHILLDQ